APVEFLFWMVVVNVSLALFNMIPLHPLDGSKVLSGLLPDVYDRRYWNFQVLYGPIILFGSILIVPFITNGAIDPIRWVLSPIRRTLLDWLL
ncbi:MAG: site-2 protease family protein, partial [Fimbriimonadales bacterium]